MIALLLAKKIAELFCYLLIGFVFVRLHVLQETDTVPLSKISLYLTTPASILYAFQIEATADVLSGFFMALGTAVLLQILFTLLTVVYGRITHASVVDRAMVIYPNVGNLVIPLVAATLGAEWVVYVSAYIVVFNVTIWTHGIRMFSGEKEVRIRKILLNPNLICCAAGFLMMLTGVRFGGIPETVIATTASFVGPLTMFITGMVMASIRMEDLKRARLLPRTVLMRMVVCALAALAVVLPIRGVVSFAGAETVLLIVLLSAVAPSANMVGQFAILYHQDAKYASVISVTTTLLCIVTMPLMIWLYGIL